MEFLTGFQRARYSQFAADASCGGIGGIGTSGLAHYVDADRGANYFRLAKPSSDTFRQFIPGGKKGSKFEGFIIQHGVGNHPQPSGK